MNASVRNAAGAGKDSGVQGRAARKKSLLRRLGDFALEAILLMIVLVLARYAEGFATWDNFMNILRSAATTGIIAFGMTFVIISGEIDLSVGSGVAFYGCLLAVLTELLIGTAWSPALAIVLGVVVCLGASLLIGSCTGFLRHVFHVPTFISTLAWMAALRGGAYLLTGSFPVTPYPDWFFFLGAGTIGGVPFQAVVFLILFVLTWFLSKYMVFGKAVYAVGGNAESARLSGINVLKVRMIVMSLTSVFSVLSGIMISSQVQAGNPTISLGLEFTVISACVIGGVSLMGGKGRIWGTFIGVLFLEIILNGMTLLNVDEYWQYVARAVLILGAVLIYQGQQAMRQRAA